MRVLYINHTGQMSGGERSLLEILRGLTASIDCLVACPDGPLVAAVEQLGVQRVAIPGTNGSLKLHPRHTPLAVAELVRAAVRVRAIARHRRVDLVHANSIRAGLVATMARGLGAPPTIVHLRDRLPASTASALTLRVLGHADLRVANSRYTAESLTEAGVRAATRVISNPVDLTRFDPRRVDRSAAQRGLGLDSRDFVVVIVAQITPWKGQREAIEAIELVRRRHPHAKLLIAGSAKFVSKATRYDNRTYLEGLHHRVAEASLQGTVRFLGETEDVRSVLGASDALLIPSWEEPFGRSMIEGMAMGLPVIATNVGGPAEVIDDGVDGLLLAPREPEAWAQAISRLIEAPQERARIAEAGRRRSRDFSVDSHAEVLRELYSEVIRDCAARDPERGRGPLLGLARR
jgi:glycosyltransferase involved in cell wall biosynthesis